MRIFFSLFLTILLNIQSYCQPSKGFQYTYVPNISTFDQTNFYVNGPLIIYAGTCSSCPSFTANSVIITSDTSGNFLNAWNLQDNTGSGIQLFKIKKVSTTVSLIAGLDYTGCSPVSNSAFIGTFNHSTGGVGTAYYYSNSNFGLGFCSGGIGGGGVPISFDATALSNGDLAITGCMSMNFGSNSGLSNMGACPSGNDGIGCMIGNFGTSSYQRGDDIFLIRTGSTGDTSAGVGNDGFVKYYSLAYAGGGYTPPQPTNSRLISGTGGNFCYSGFPSWMCDSTRMDEPTGIIEDATNHYIYIVGWTLDYCQDINCNSFSGSGASPHTTGTPFDYEAFVLKVNESGATQWCHTYLINGPTTAYEKATGVALVTSDASYDPIITIASQQSNSIEIARVSHTDGHIIWANSYNMNSYNVAAWSIKQTTNNTFIIGAETQNGPTNSYDDVLLEITAAGAVVNTKGFIATGHTTDGQNWRGPDVDQFGTGTYAISSTSYFGGGNTNGAYIVKANRSSNTSGCTANQFTTTPVSITNRNSGGVNQLKIRTPVVYEFRGEGTSKTAVTMTSVAITGTTTSNKICVLPIELLSFAAVKNKASVELNWVTATETNNDYFTIEKSLDAISFESVLNVQGAGTSSHINEYSAMDNNPLEGISYYRLKQTDFDGKFTYSNIVSVNYSGADNFNVFHGTTDYIVNFNSNKPDNYKLKIINSIGQEIIRETISSITGNFEKSYDLREFGNGVYMIYIISSNNTYVKKINVY